jgi:predicted Zn-dependent protease
VQSKIPFIARSTDDTVNVSRTHPLAELFWMLGGLVVLCGIIFIALGIITDLVVARVPVKVERALRGIALDQYGGERHPALNEIAGNLLAQVPRDSPLHDYEINVYLMENEEINAVALPGGNIVVFTGLVAQVESENELAMVLAHEMGHFSHRDHLRGLGRGLGLAVIVSLLFGPDSSASDLVSGSLLSFQAHYSQDQEADADRYGLDLLVRSYGHAGGSIDFFERLAAQHPDRLPYLFASHPHPDARIAALKERIDSYGYPSQETIPLDSALYDVR